MRLKNNNVLLILDTDMIFWIAQQLFSIGLVDSIKNHLRLSFNNQQETYYHGVGSDINYRITEKKIAILVEINFLSFFEF